MKKIFFFLAFMTMAILSNAQPWLLSDTPEFFTFDQTSYNQISVGDSSVQPPNSWVVYPNYGPDDISITTEYHQHRDIDTTRPFKMYGTVTPEMILQALPKCDTLKPIISWDTTGYKHTVKEPEDDGSVLVFKQIAGDTLSVFDPVLKLWVPTNKVLVPRSKSQYRPGPLFKTRPKGTRKQVADAMMITAAVGYFVTGYHAGAAERELSNEGWPRNKSSHVYRDVSIWGDAGFGAMWGASIAINWNQELHGKTLLRAALSAIACGGLRYAGTRAGYYKN